jgi:biopolymer transport protein ExbD/biopolymer transport protein TolR
VDVVLVLLIIFMLTAHVMEFGIEVTVPQVKYVKDTAQQMPVITIDKTGDSTLDGKKVDINDVVVVIHRQFPAAKGVYVRADKETTWDPIAQVTAELGEGKLQVYMVTQPVDAAARRH